MRFTGRVYKDGSRLKIVANGLPLGRYEVVITKVDGKPAELSFTATITSNGPRLSKFRPPPFSELKPGSVVEGKILENDLRCKWCGARVSALLNGFCDDCFEYFNSPYKPSSSRGLGMADVGHRPKTPTSGR
jgi:hypothetical protein